MSQYVEPLSDYERDQCIQTITMAITMMMDRDLIDIKDDVEMIMGWGD